MNSPGTDHQLRETLEDASIQPWRHSFFSLLRTISAQSPDLPAIGKSQRPQQEMFRLGQQASLAFASREIAKVFERDGLTHIHLYGLGMLGPNGALPIHFTEQVRERSEARRDHTLGDFLNIFHHRAFTLLYRAWSQSQSAIGLDRADDETFTPYIARLIGDEPEEVANSVLPSHVRWASSAHRIRASHDPEGLVNTLQRFFDVPVRIEEYRLQWMDIEPQDICRLGHPSIATTMGQGAMLGEKIPDRQTRFRLIIGPLDLESYLRMTPQGVQNGQNLPVLVELVRSFIDFEYVWEVELLILREAAPAARLGGDTQLGWSTWMSPSGGGSSSDISGMILEPENYVTDLDTGNCNGVSLYD